MVGWVWVPALGLVLRAGTVVAVVERGGFLWFYDFFLLVLWLLYIFLVPESCSMVVTLTGSLMVVPGVFDGFIAYGQGRWLYGEGFFFLSFAWVWPFVLLSSSFPLLVSFYFPFWVPSFVRSLVVTSRLVSVAVCCPLFR